MTKYLSSAKFSVGGANSKAYDEGWERIFGKKNAEERPADGPCPMCGETSPCQHHLENAPISDVEFKPE